MKLLAVTQLALLTLAPVCLADVTYTYTGNNYDFVSGSPFTTEDHFTASFTVNHALPALTPYVFNPENTFAENSTLLGWSSFDGVYSINSANPDPSSFLLGEVMTDAAGDISTWAFTIGEAESVTSSIALSESSCSAPFACGSILVPSAPMDYVQVNIGPGTYIGNAASDTAGTWTMINSSAPEPSFTAISGVLICLLIYIPGRRPALRRGEIQLECQPDLQLD